MISFLAAIFVFGILIFIHEFGHFIMAKKNGVRVEKFSFGFGPKLWAKKAGDTEYRVCAIPLGGYIKMAGDEPAQQLRGTPDEFLSKTCWQRAQIVAAGPILNYLLALALFTLVFVIGAPVLTTRVGELLDDYPAKSAGIQKDDLILSVDAQQVENWQDMAAAIQQKTEGVIVLTVQRKERVFTLKVQPRVEENEDIFGQKVKIALLGISPSEELTQIKYPLGKSFVEGGKKLINLTGLTYKSLWFIITRRMSFKESFAGPIYIFKLTGSAAKMGFIYLLNFMSLLSMSLAIFNVLPFPVLDGGHLFFLVLEKIRRRPLSARTQELATQGGIVVLITLFLVVSYYDAIRSGWGEKAQKLWQKISPEND